MPKVLVFYHYFHPDDIVSAQIYTDLCLGIKERGWDVTVMPCDEGFQDKSSALPLRETWNGIRIRRIWRLPLSQSSTHGRILNALWMLGAWSLASLFYRPDAIIIGTDPIFGVLVAIPWKLLHPRTRILHWCFDLYPEAAIAAGIISERGLLAKALKSLLRRAYKCCDVIGSLGACMSRLLEVYGPHLNIVELTPWALVEPAVPLIPEPAERKKVFGDANLTLMYSGSFGRAHSYETLLLLARSLRGRGIAFAFSVRGHRVDELKAAVTKEDTNLTFADFVPQAQLEQHLSAADIHIVTLRSEFTGTVVPSKFQGAIATGRPILFAGDPDSALGNWIRIHGLGWCLTKDNIHEIAAELMTLELDPERMSELRSHCFQTYHQQFSKAAVISRLHHLLLATQPTTSIEELNPVLPQVIFPHYHTRV